MELILERGLEHQQKAVDAVKSVFNDVIPLSPEYTYMNPQIDLTSMRLNSNLNTVLRLNKSGNTYNFEKDCLRLDIKMETGTGKTYVYTQTIYELHKTLGLNKFIIVVPTLPIKAGTSQFITDGYVKRHFCDDCGYNSVIDLKVVESPKQQKAKKSLIPSAIREFVSGSFQNTNKIYVMLVNMQLLTNGNLLSKDYDQLLEGYYRPFDAIAATKPVVIIDEPHRFDKSNKAYQVIMNELKPQLLIRYGATFPDVTEGRGKNKQTHKDYNNLIYELNACDSFNQGLIKGVIKEHFEPLSKKEQKVKVTNIKARDSVTFKLISQKGNKVFNLKKGDSLSEIDDAFYGITVSEITSKNVVLSNGQEKSLNEEFNTDIYSSSYQEQILKLAIQRHFETERQNFMERRFKIKTLALFFIDDISSYRKTEDKVPYLKEAFERLLREKIEELLADRNLQSDYRDYLQVSLEHISDCHAGYFAQDNDDSDESIAKEVNDILHNKKALLSIHNPDGTYNVRRFLFSKWTLKEGWDNPNVFTIAKLRSSGSENSKLQEVGRGLRLPVDEYGNRISNETFKLNYIVDFTEADFAQKLVNEINGELSKILSITDDMLSSVAQSRHIDINNLFIDLLNKKYITFNKEIIQENADKFYSEYPEFNNGVQANKIIDANQNKKDHAIIRANKFNELKELWEQINKKYYLFYENSMNETVEKILREVINLKDIFSKEVLVSNRKEVRSENGQMVLSEDLSGVSYFIKKDLPYGEFLKRLCQQTSIPIKTAHQLISEHIQTHSYIPKECFNEYSLAKIVSAFKDRKNNQSTYSYAPSDIKVKETALTYKDGNPKQKISLGRIGTNVTEGIAQDKYLYDTVAFDSPLERRNILSEIDEVKVFGKIPRSSIAIPTILGENYSPDFMYIVKKKDGTQELNIIVETKDVDGETALRDNERIKIKCAEKFFEELSKHSPPNLKISFKTQINTSEMKDIINGVLTE